METWAVIFLQRRSAGTADTKKEHTAINLTAANKKFPVISSESRDIILLQGQKALRNNVTSGLSPVFNLGLTPESRPAFNARSWRKIKWQAKEITATL